MKHILKLYILLLTICFFLPELNFQVQAQNPKQLKKMKKAAKKKQKRSKKPIQYNANANRKDSDGDGVADYKDHCENTPTGQIVTPFGCPIDKDFDGVVDSLDACIDIAGPANNKGCPLPTKEKLVVKNNKELDNIKPTEEKLVLEKAQQFFQNNNKLDNLKNGLVPSKCVTIDVSSALHIANQPYTYVWKLGDGSQKVGAKIRHCYPRNERYTASLTLADSATEVYFENEVVLNVNLETDSLLIKGISSVSINEIVKLSPHFISGRKYNVDYFWDFGNNEYSTKSIGKVKFSKAGVYKVRLGAIVKKKKKKYVLLCEREIRVNNFLSPKNLIDAFDNKSLNDDKKSPYLREDIQFTIIDTFQKKSQVVESIEKYGYNIEIEKEKTYQIYAKKGNIFSDIITFSTKQSTNILEAKSEFKKAINRLTKSLHRIPSVYFQQTETSTNNNEYHKHDSEKEGALTKESELELKKVATILNEYPKIKIRIGVYSYSGSRSINLVKLSMLKDRGTVLKEGLTGLGIDPNRIEIAQNIDTKEPTSNQQALNDCINCTRELDRRAEFKVIQLQ